MIDGAGAVAAFLECGITDVVWLPDSQLGTWEAALRAADDLRLIRVCREGEAMAIAAGLILGGRQPIVLIQCTGFFEAGDAFRNVVHDLKLPLFLVIDVRSYTAHKEGRSVDTCPIFTEPIVQAWRVPYVFLDRSFTGADLIAAYRQAQTEQRAGLVLLAE